MTATEELRRLLDERGVEWRRTPHYSSESQDNETIFEGNGIKWYANDHLNGRLGLRTARYEVTPEQAIDATLGREPWSDPTWERWHESLRHDEIKSIVDAVEQLMYEAIKFGGDMGPNGNTYNGIDEGDVLTSGFIKAWAARFESTLGRDRYSYEQFREISNAVGDAMEYAHDRAIEHPDVADPLWNLDEYVNRILKVAFKGEATLGRGTCHPVASDNLTESEGTGDAWADCSECGHLLCVLTDPSSQMPNYCPNCGARVVPSAAKAEEDVRMWRRIHANWLNGGGRR